MQNIDKYADIHESLFIFAPLLLLVKQFGHVKDLDVEFELYILILLMVRRRY